MKIIKRIVEWVRRLFRKKANTKKIMRTELFIENYRLDITEDISTLLNFAIDDIKDFASRSTTWSKTIVLPGTANNNKLFGHIFQVGQSNIHTDSLPNVGYNFNAAKAADCALFQDFMQTFKGVLRLLQINIDKGKIEYEIAIFGEMAGLNVALSSGLLEQLDFSDYDEAYNETNIVASWANTSGVGVYYPLIDYGLYSTPGNGDKHDWDFRTFRPALHVKEYIDKMFTAAGFRYQSALFDTARFKRLIIPYNRKLLYASSDNYIDANTSGQTDSAFTTTKIRFPNITEINSFTANSPTNSSFNYDSPSSITVQCRLTVQGDYLSVTEGINFYIYKDDGLGVTQVAFISLPASPAGSSFSIDITGQITINQNEDFYCDISYEGVDTVEVNITSARFLVTPVSGQSAEIAYNGNIVMNNTIPKNVRQIDFLSSIVKLFNLYVYESRLDIRMILITPYVDFYSTDSSDSVDWTYKLNRDKIIKIKPMSELTSKIYEFKYKQDSDFYNEAYRKRYGQGYGDYIYDNQYEFTDHKNATELIFSATPLVGYDGEEKVYPTIFKQSNDTEERIDSNLRIMQSKLITGVSSWDIKDGVSVLSSHTEYGYAGHFDDPDAPDNDLNFGVVAELFFELLSGDLTKTQFNVYWSSYMAEITDKDSKLLIAWFYLTAKDILDLDFSKKVYVDGALFRLNSIKDYNVTRPTDTEVELLKINYLIY